MRDQIDVLWDKYWNEMKSEWIKFEALHGFRSKLCRIIRRKTAARHWTIGWTAIGVKPLSCCKPMRTWIHGLLPAHDGRDIKLMRTHMVKEPLLEYMEW